MADKRQLEILKSGVEAWNEWREEIDNSENPYEESVDLSHASLSAANFRGVDFLEADLSHADLSRANLYGNCCDNRPARPRSGPSDPVDWLVLCLLD